jgi:hypothetical protein
LEPRRHKVFPIQPSKIAGSGGLVPNVFNLAAEAAENFPQGTPMRVRSADGLLEEHPLLTTVIDIYGFSLEGVNAGSYDNPSGKVAVAKADRNTEFVSKARTSGAYATDLSAVYVGNTYGLIKVGTGQSAVFAVDLDDTTNVVVQITKVDDTLDLVWWKVLESALQEP